MTHTNPIDLTVVSLPKPNVRGEITLEDAMLRRRSVREFAGRPLTQEQLSQLLWSAQGVTGHADHKRTPPSAGALHPLETYVVIGNVGGFDPGIYRYAPDGHSLALVANGDVRLDLGRAAVDQIWLAEAPVAFVFSAIYERTTQKYGDRGIRYVHMDAGFAAENLHLQAVALGLGTVVMGAFVDVEVQRVMQLPADEQPLLILPVGWPKR
jgi:SagB-type dehydrogenase family enzyme